MNDANSSADAKRAFERGLASHWLPRVAVFVLLAGLAFLPLGGSPVGLAFLALIAVGLWFSASRLAEDSRLTEVVTALRAAALAVAYLATYVLVYGEPSTLGRGWLGGVLLAGVAVGLWRVLDRRRSELLALLTVALSWFAISVSSSVSFALTSHLLLAAVAAGLLARHGWQRLGWLGLVLSFVGFLGWRLAGGTLDWYRPPAVFWRSFSYLVASWLLLTAAALWAGRHGFVRARRVSFLTAANLAVWVFALATFPRVYPNSVWQLAAVCGLVLLALAGWTAWRLRADQTLWRAYLAQGLMLIAWAVAELASEQTGLRLAIVAAAALVASHFARSVLLGRAGDTLAVLAVLATWGMVDPDVAGRAGGLTVTAGVETAGVVAILLWCAWWVSRGLPQLGRFRWRVGLHGALAVVLLGWLILAALPTIEEPPMLALGALLLSLSFYYLWWVPEIPILAHGHLLAAFCLWLGGQLTPLPFVGAALGAHLEPGLARRPLEAGSGVPPTWGTLVLIAVALVLIHWWRREARHLLPQKAIRWLECLYSAAVVAVLWIALRASLAGGPEVWLLALVAVALGTLVYGLWSKANWLALFGQVFMVAAAVELAGLLAGGPPRWWIALPPIAAMAATPWLARCLRPDLAPRPAGGRRPAEDRVHERGPRRLLPALYLLTAILLLVAWIEAYPVFPARFFGLEVLATVLLVWGIASDRKGALLGALATATAGVMIFWMDGNGASGFRWLDLFAFTLLLGQQQLAQLLLGDDEVPQPFHDLAIIVGISSLWHWTTRWAGYHFEPWTALAWAVLALVVFTIGAVTHERGYRAMAWVVALGGTLLTLGAGGLSDSLPPALGVAALGAALLTFGVVYNLWWRGLRRDVP